MRGLASKSMQCPEHTRGAPRRDGRRDVRTRWGAPVVNMPICCRAPVVNMPLWSMCPCGQYAPVVNVPLWSMCPCGQYAHMLQSQGFEHEELGHDS